MATAGESVLKARRRHRKAPQLRAKNFQQFFDEKNSIADGMPAFLSLISHPISSRYTRILDEKRTFFSLTPSTPKMYLAPLPAPTVSARVEVSYRVPRLMELKSVDIAGI